MKNGSMVKGSQRHREKDQGKERERGRESKSVSVIEKINKSEKERYVGKEGH